MFSTALCTLKMTRALQIRAAIVQQEMSTLEMSAMCTMHPESQCKILSELIPRSTHGGVLRALCF